MGPTTSSSRRAPITKRFPGLVANDAIDFDLRRGEVHCLLGENGAGKTTLMNVIFGLYQPDAGTIRIDGNEVQFTSSADAIACGIGMVHQHFQLIPVFTVAENIVLGDELRRGPVLDLETARKRIVELGERYGLRVDPDAKVEDLSVGQQQRVELLKALFREADILILDEPTAVLTPGEVDEFFAIVRSLIDQGKSIVFITHKLREVLEVADRITVLRHGRVVGTSDPTAATQQTLATLMVGRDVSFEIDKPPARPGRTQLEVRELVVTDDRGFDSVSGLSFTVREGEIFGIAGVEGNGQRELVEAIAGMRTPASGTIEISGVDLTGAGPRQMHEHGVGHVPEDRNKHGVVSAFTIADNLVLNTYYRAPFARRRIRQLRDIEKQAHELVRALRRPHPEHRQPGVEPVGRQPAEGDHRPRAHRRSQAAARRATDARPGRRFDRVHPSPDRRDARRRIRDPARRARSWTRSSPSPTASACCTAASWSVSSTGPTRHVTRSGSSWRPGAPRAEAPA